MKKWWCKWFALSNSGKETGREKKKTIAEQAKSRVFQRRSVLVFLVTFGLLMGLFYAIVAFTPFYERAFSWYLGFNARFSGVLLTFLGQNITVEGNAICSPHFSVRVVRGCDAVEATVLFICAILAFPAPFLRKIPGIIAGMLLLAILNFIRIVSLFLVGVYFPRAFDIAHLEVWEGLFIVSAVIFWVIWLLWATQRPIERQRA
jgi:exosortase H (IPTLxxWG-CTERM-specific)